MRHLNRLAPALVVLYLLALADTSASGLPDISLTLAGATYPLRLGVTLLTVRVRLSNVSGATTNSEGALVVIFLNELGHLGTYEVLLTKVKKGSTGCFSEEGGKKDPTEEVLTRGSWHLVYTSLTGSTQGLQLGILSLASPVAVKCGSEEVTVKGDGLGSVNSLAGTEAEEYTSASGVLLGNGEGSPNIKFFYNEAGTSVKAKLEANFGTGFKEAAAEVAGEALSGSTSEGKMLLVTSR